MFTSLLKRTGWNSTDRQSAFVVKCWTLDRHKVTLPVALHYDIPKPNLFLSFPDALSPAVETLRSAITEQAGRRSFAELNQQLSEIRDGATSQLGGRAKLPLSRRILETFGIRIIDLMVGSPELEAEFERAIANATVQKIAAGLELEKSVAEKESRHSEFERLLASLGKDRQNGALSPEFGLIVLLAYLKYEAMVRGGRTDTAVIFDGNGATSLDAMIYDAVRSGRFLPKADDKPADS